MEFGEIVKREHQRMSEMMERLEESSEGSLKTRERVSRQLAQLLAEHAQKEEMHLYPALERHAEAHEAIGEFLGSAGGAHAEMTRLAGELDVMAKDDASFTERAGELRKAAQTHMREEERLLSPLRRALDEEETEALDRAVAGRGEEMAEGAAAAVRRGAEQTTEASGAALRRGAESAGEQVESANRAVLAAAGIYGETAQLTTEDIQAIATCSSIAAGGMGEMRQAWIEWMSRGWRAGARASQELMRCTTIEQLADIQRNFLKESLDSLLESSAQMLRISSRISEDAARPIEDRVLQLRRGVESGGRARRAAGD
ncbi:MAG TPA: hemerythrin domain-containing protein [Stellaceae bacterium]|nr:hemerythrin domain-containing protein [Stellaceae bacterium]